MSRMLPANWTIALLFALIGTVGGMQSAVSQTAADAAVEIELGLGGTWKLGHVCPVRIRLSEKIRGQATRIEVQTVDGDGVEVAYCQSLADIETTTDGSLWMSIRIGRQSADVSLRVIGDNGSVLAEQAVDTSARRGLPSAQPLVVAIGSAMGIDELSRKSSDGSRATFSTITLDSAAAFPPTWRDYSSCDLILLSCRDVELLADLDSRQLAVDNGNQRPLTRMQTNDDERRRQKKFKGCCSGFQAWRTVDWRLGGFFGRFVRCVCCVRCDDKDSTDTKKGLTDGVRVA